MAWTTPITYTSGQVLTASQMNVNVRDNTNAIYDSIKRIGRQTRASAYTVNQTAVGSAADVFSSDITWTADGTSAYRIEFFCPSCEAAAGGFTNAHIVTGTGTDLGQIGQIYSGTGSSRGPLYGIFYYTPSAGSASVNVRGTYAIAGNGSFYSTDQAFTTMFLNVYGPNLT